jgi:hypothetical protein
VAWVSSILSIATEGFKFVCSNLVSVFINPNASSPKIDL